MPDAITARPDEDGGIDLVRDADDAGPSLIVGHIQSPWATDANGQPVATSFVLDGDMLVQHVDFGDWSAFPVVADPSIIWNGVSSRSASSSTTARPPRPPQANGPWHR